MSERRRLDIVGGVDIKEKGLSREEVYDRGTWRCISSYIDPHKSGNMILTLTMIFIYGVKQNIRDLIGQ